MNTITKASIKEAVAVALAIWGFLGLHGKIAVYMMTFDPDQSAAAAKILLIGVIMATGVIFGFGSELPRFARRASFLMLSYLAFLGLTAALHYLRDGWPNGGRDAYNEAVYLGTALIAIGALVMTRRRFWR